MLSGYVKFDVILTDKTDNIFIDGNQKNRFQLLWKKTVTKIALRTLSK